MVTIDFQKLIFGSRRSDEYQGRTFGTAGTSQGATEGESTSEIVVFNQSALLIVGIVVIAALLIFPAFGQNLGLTRSDRHEGKFQILLKAEHDQLMAPLSKKPVHQVLHFKRDNLPIFDSSTNLVILKVYILMFRILIRK